MEETTVITVNQPMNTPVIAQITDGPNPSAVDGERLSAVTGIPIVERTRDLPLSFAQERLWFLAQMEGGSKAYQSLRGFHLQGELKPTALRQALNQIVARHEALRTVFTLVHRICFKPLSFRASWLNTGAPDWSFAGTLMILWVIGSVAS